MESVNILQLFLYFKTQIEAKQGEINSEKFPLKKLTSNTK